MTDRVDIDSVIDSAEGVRDNGIRLCPDVGLLERVMPAFSSIVIRAGQLLPSLLRHTGAMDPDEQAAFALHAAGMVRQLAVLACMLMLVATVVWWPVDRLVFEDPEVIDAFATLRGRAVALELAGLLVFGLTRPHAVWTPVLAVAAHALLMGSFGYSLGVLGGGGLALMADAQLGLVPSALLPLSLRARCVGLAMIATAFAGGWWAALPGQAEVPGVAVQWSFLTFVVLFSLVAGEAMTRIIRRAWVERRALDAANAQLAALTHTLNERVEERTLRLRNLTRRLDETQELERRRIAHDLHDDLGQQVAGMRYTLARLEHQLGDASDTTADLLADMGAALEGTAGSVRSVVTRLRPRMLDDLGLAPSLEWLCEDVARRAGVFCSLEASGGDLGAPIDPRSELVLFRAAQEATTNALKHAAPSRLRVSLHLTADAVSVVIEDDGIGFDVDAPSPGLGLFAMRERVDALAGELRLISAPRGGTKVIVTLPRRVEDQGAGR